MLVDIPHGPNIFVEGLQIRVFADEFMNWLGGMTHHHFMVDRPYG